MTKTKELTSDDPTRDPKLRAFTDVVEALAPLDRVSRVDVLRAAANFYGLVGVIEKDAM